MAQACNRFFQILKRLIIHTLTIPIALTRLLFKSQLLHKLIVEIQLPFEPIDGR